MSLYFEAAGLLENSDGKTGSLKSRVYGRKDLKSSPGALFALVTEASKWSGVLKEVVEKSELLRLERKLTPTLALLLVHDLILAKKGIAAPKQHVLSIAVTKHKARLGAEFTKLRLRQGFATVDAFRAHVNAQQHVTEADTNGDGPKIVFHPRWIRVNTVRTSLDEAISSTFVSFTPVRTLAELAGAEKGIYIDAHIPDLVAISPRADLSKDPAYLCGEIIFQDKASCFPAYLLDPQSEDNHVIDTCAAPGNKTTHIAALLRKHAMQSSGNSGSPNVAKVTACERDATRAETLKKMVKLAGAEKIVTVKAAQDFMKLDPASDAYAEVGALLLDPSCSGSGIVGRDDGPTPVLHLPTIEGTPQLHASTSKKRKRKSKAPASTETPAPPEPEAIVEESPQSAELEEDKAKLQTRLTNLSGFQYKLLCHALSFPAATKITYSTCSIHAEENEHVVVKALCSRVARKGGWRVLRRDEQVDGMKRWQVRGSVTACEEKLEDLKGAELVDPLIVADACIRCEKGTEDGTMGFFVAGFVRDRNHVNGNVVNGQLAAVAPRNEEDDEWGGFSDSGDE